MTLHSFDFPLIQEALARRDEPEAWAEFSTLLKAANAHKHFWRPIEECPKEDMRNCFLLIKRKKIPRIGCWRRDSNAWHIPHTTWLKDEDILFFAEIPPLPDEAKP